MMIASPTPSLHCASSVPSRHASPLHHAWSESPQSFVWATEVRPIPTGVRYHSPGQRFDGERQPSVMVLASTRTFLDRHHVLPSADLDGQPHPRPSIGTGVRGYRAALARPRPGHGTAAVHFLGFRRRDQTHLIAHPRRTPPNPRFATPDGARDPPDWARSWGRRTREQYTRPARTDRAGEQFFPLHRPSRDGDHPYLRLGDGLRHLVSLLAAAAGAVGRRLQLRQRALRPPSVPNHGALIAGRARVPTATSSRRYVARHGRFGLTSSTHTLPRRRSPAAPVTARSSSPWKRPLPARPPGAAPRLQLRLVRPVVRKISPESPRTRHPTIQTCGNATDTIGRLLPRQLAAAADELHATTTPPAAHR